MTEQIQTRWTAETILDFLRAHREELRGMGVVKIGLFGSYARGEQREDSDMDFLITMSSPSFKNFMHVWNFLEDNFEHKIDIGEEKLLREEIRPEVMRDVIYV